MGGVSEPIHRGVEVACELAELAADLVESTYRREHPGATDAEVASRLREWWTDRPGAPHGDADGVPRANFTS
jgi:hypothetical protein